MTQAAARRVVIVGGGFTGACAAVALLRHSTRPLAITLVDPAEQPGRGLAYSATDPDHRLNAPTWSHTLLPDDALHFDRWCRAQGLAMADPEALQPDGSAYFRRRDLGRYLQQTLAAHAHGGPGPSTIVHRRDWARAATPAPAGAALQASASEGEAGGAAFTVHTEGGARLPADALLLATGNPVPRLRAPFAPALAVHPAVIENPLAPGALERVAPGARVLLVGSGLTAMDVLSTLVRRGHAGSIEVVSRHGLRPRRPGPLPAALAPLVAAGPAALDRLPGTVMLERLAAPPPAFLAAEAVPATVRAWLRVLRGRVAQVQAEGGSWHMPFDDLRDALWQLWPRLPAREQRRFLRQLKPWYDVHRYRSAPPNDVLVDAALAAGRIRWRAARIAAVQPLPAALRVALRAPGADTGLAQPQDYDQVINCTGLDIGAAIAAQPLLAGLLAAGCLRLDACGWGLAVDVQARAIDAAGRALGALRVLGPPTVGSFGDPIGAMFIGAQVMRMLPDLLRALDRPA